MQLRQRQVASAPDVLCKYCGRKDFKNNRGLAMHLRRSNCAEQHKQHQPLQPQSQASASSRLPAASSPTNIATSSLVAQLLLITVETLFAIFIHVSNLINHVEGFLMILCGYLNAFVDMPGLFRSIYYGCMFFWTLCTDPDNISAPFLPDSIQPYWDKAYDFLDTYVDMAFVSSRLFDVWKFLITPIRIDPEALYARIDNNPNLAPWMKAALIRLGKLVELLIGSYLFKKVLFWSFNALFACILFVYLLLKGIFLASMN